MSVPQGTVNGVGGRPGPGSSGHEMQSRCHGAPDRVETRTRALKRVLAGRRASVPPMLRHSQQVHSQRREFVTLSRCVAAPEIGSLRPGVDVSSRAAPATLQPAAREHLRRRGCAPDERSSAFVTRSLRGIAITIHRSTGDRFGGAVRRAIDRLNAAQARRLGSADRVDRLLPSVGPTTAFVNVPRSRPVERLCAAGDSQSVPGEATGVMAQGVPIAESRDRRGPAKGCLPCGQRCRRSGSESGVVSPGAVGAGRRAARARV